jgi:hypothetical protein
MLKGKNLLLLALVGGGAYWYWMKMKKDKAAKTAKAVGSTNFYGDEPFVDAADTGRSRFQLKGNKLVIKLGKKY